MTRIELFQSFLLLANASSVQKLLCIFQESNSTLEYFSKSFITNFNHVNTGRLRWHFILLWASCKAFRAGVSWCLLHEFFLFFHINLCCLFFLTNVCQLLFVAFCDESCRFVAQDSLSMSLVQSCKEICILYG